LPFHKPCTSCIWLGLDSNKKTSLINTIIFLRRNYKTISNASGQVGSTHHQPRYNLDTTDQVFTRVSGLKSPRLILRIYLTDSFTTFQRFELVEESLTCPFCWNDFLFSAVIRNDFFCFVCVCVRVCVKATTMSSKGWFNLEAGTSVVPETQFFEGDSAFKFLGLSKTTRLYGFIAWCVF